MFVFIRTGKLKAVDEPVFYINTGVHLHLEMSGILFLQELISRLRLPPLFFVDDGTSYEGDINYCPCTNPEPFILELTVNGVGRFLV